MKRKNVLQKDIQGLEVTVNDPVFKEIHEIQAETDQLMAELNTGYHTKEETADYLAQIIGEPLDPSVTVMLPFYTDFGRHITLGKDIFINRQAMFVDLGGIILEDQVLIGPRASLLSVNHPENPEGRRGVIAKPIHIKKNAWIGAGATVLQGITIGENSIVAANATVTKDVPDNVVVAGTPAKVMKTIDGK